MKYRPDPLCITSTPKSGVFLKKQPKWPKYERDSCIPEPKNGERPYLAVPEPTFWGLFSSSFLAYFIRFNPTLHDYFIYIFSSQTNNSVWDYYTIIITHLSIQHNNQPGRKDNNIGCEC